MTLYEYVGNLHMHTPYSDGEAYHSDIASVALKAGLDFVVVTDHNVRVDGVEGYYGISENRKVLLLVGEEIHDMRRRPQGNHLLAYNVNRELAPYAAHPQNLIDQITSEDGLSFLAHPFDKAAPLFGEDSIPWSSYDVEGFTGIELWNYMSELKSHLTSYAAALRMVVSPDSLIMGPHPETLDLWDTLLKQGKQVRIIGNADAHGTTYSWGPFKRTILPYEYLFRCVNTHVLTSRPLTGDLSVDRRLLFQAIKDGHCFVGYDLISPTRGFRFVAHGHNFDTTMGGTIRLGHGVTFQLATPQVGIMRLLKDGEIIDEVNDNTHRTFIVSKPGVYRVEVYLKHKGKRRGWIFSNPIFVLK